MLGPLQRLRSLLLPHDTQSQVGYTPIATDPDAPADLALDSERGTRSRQGRDVYLCFWVLGAGVLLPWNALMCTFPLLISLADDSLKASLPSTLSTAFCFANLFFLGLAQRNVSTASPISRARWSLLLLLAACVVLAYPVLPAILPALSSGNAGAKAMFLPLILALTFVLAVTTSFLQSAVIALAALWGSGETLAVMSGQGGIAVLVSGSQVILAALGSAKKSGESEGVSGAAGFGLWALGAAFVVVCIWSLKRLTQHPAFNEVLAPFVNRSVQGGEGEGKKGVTMAIAKKNQRLEFAVAFVFVVTLSVFPPITTTITSQTKFLSDGVFIALHFLLFNVGDYAGRTYLSAVGLGSMTIPRIVLMSISRVAFIPLFLFCNIPARAEGNITAFPDLIYFIILLAFGLTNGWVSTLCMMFASSPDLNPAIDEDEKDVAGTLAAFSLVSGLAIGSMCSFGVTYAISGSPFGG